MCLRDRAIGESRVTAAYRTFFVVFLLYPLLSRTVFRTFDCQELHRDELSGITEQWHVDDFSVDCNSASHGTFRFVAGVFILVYPVGIPLCFLFLLWRDNQQRTQSEQARGVSSFDFLRRDYKDSFYFFEVIVLLEKLLLTGVLIFIKHGTILQAFAGATIAFVFFGLQCRLWPYKAQSDNILKAFAEGQLFLTLFISVILRTQLEREPVTSEEYGLSLIHI